MNILYFLQAADSIPSNPPPQDLAGMMFQIIIGFVGGTAGTTFISKLFDVQKVKQLTKMMYELEAAQKDLAEEKFEKDLLQKKLEEYTERQTTGITNRLSELEKQCRELRENNELKEEQCRELRENNELKERQLEKAKRILKANNINVNRER